MGATETADCFVIMPIADPDGYEKGHFSKVYEDIFQPACRSAGFAPVRADEVRQTNLIHLDILQKLISSPMAICDLSSRNPNVLFELGLRQAFDKPTVLVQEVGTVRIFDIAPLRYTEYRKELRYRDVLEDQKAISLALKATLEATSNGDGVNSIVRILSLSKPAALNEGIDNDSTGLLKLVRAEMSQMRSDFQSIASRLGPRGLDHPRRYIGSGPKSMMEARECLVQAEVLLTNKAPMETTVDVINRAQKLLARYMDGDVPDRFRVEAQQLFATAEALERRAVEQQKSP